MATVHPPPLSTEALKKSLDLSHFDFNAVIRGMQLTLVGANRALQNPAIFTNAHYKQAAYAVAAGIAIRLVIAIPIFAVKVLLWVLSFCVSMDDVTWDDSILNGLDFTAEYVLQIPFFLMVLMRYVTPTLDNLFMESLRWVDTTYVQKHRSDDPTTLRSMYYPTLSLYSPNAAAKAKVDPSAPSRAKTPTAFLARFAKKGLLSISVYALSFVPVVGRLILPLASFYTFNNAVGLGPASVIFATGLLLPRSYLVVFLQTYFSSRSLMRELLEPYFARVPFTTQQKKAWFHSRAGLLFGFALGFNMLARVPLVGVLVYGIAEASTAFLITKITDPVPHPSHAAGFAESQLEWKNKQKFLSLSLSNLDAVHAASGTPPTTPPGDHEGPGSEIPPSYDEAVAPPGDGELRRRAI